MLRSVVIAGAGQAGFQTAASLRQDGFAGRIVIIGDEPGLPYQRPPLSKAYLMGKTTAEALTFRPEKFFADNRIELIAQTRVTAIDRTNKELSVIEKVRQFAFADEPFTIDNGEMTPTLKIRRHAIRQRYADRIDALYKG